MEMKNESGFKVPDFTNLEDRSQSSSYGPNRFSNASLYRRRLANDPDMMYELHRYRKLMLLTLLPNIAADADESTSLLHPHGHLRPIRITPTPPIEEGQFPHSSHRDLEINPLKDSIPPSTSNFESEFALLQTDNAIENKLFYFEEEEEPEKMNNLSFLTAQTVGDPDQFSKSMGFIGSAGNSAASTRGNIKSACSETRLPPPGRGVTLQENKNTHVDRSMYKNHRRYSYNPPGDGVGSGSVNNGHGEDTSELDLLTLAELYLESRHRVFGDEWNQRQNLQARSSSGAASKVAGTGIHQRPHRLSPLARDAAQGPDLPKITASNPRNTGGMPTTGGLHLSVNYTNNLDREASMMLLDRARALKPRLRRLNSLDDLSTTGGAAGDDTKEEELYRPSSAPDMAKKQHEDYDDSDPSHYTTPVDVTPARANTPTSALPSSAQSRPPLMGASLATSLARVTSSRSRPETRDSKRGTSLSPEGARNSNLLTNLYPEQLLSRSSSIKTGPEHFISRSSSIKAVGESKRFVDLDILQELQASVRNYATKSKVGMNKKLIGPIGIASSSNHRSVDSQKTTSLKGSSSVKVKSKPKILDTVGNHRPLHQSLPARLSTPLLQQPLGSMLTPPPTAMSESGRRNSKIVLTPLDSVGKSPAR